MQMKDLMWEMFLSTGHVCAYLLYKEYEQDDIMPDFEVKLDDACQQKIPVS